MQIVRDSISYFGHDRHSIKSEGQDPGSRRERRGAGAVWTPRDFLDLGARASVDKTLQGPTRAGHLRRVARSLYDIPSFNRLTQNRNPPDRQRVIEAIARRDQMRVLVDGMTAANDL